MPEVLFSQSIFPCLQNLEPGKIPQPDSADDYNLGDIFLGVEYIFQHCTENEDYYDILTVSGNAEMTAPGQRNKIPVLPPAARRGCDMPRSSHTSYRTRVIEGDPQGEEA